MVGLTTCSHVAPEQAPRSQAVLLRMSNFSYINAYFMLSLFDKWTLHCFGFQLRVFQTVCCTEAVIDADFACFAWGMSGSFIDIDSGHDNHKQKYYQHSSVQAGFNLRFLPVTKCFSRRYACSIIPLIYIKYKNMMQRIYVLRLNYAKSLL